MKKFFSQLWSHSHELGTIYYTWSILASLGSAAYGAYKLLSDQTASTSVFFYAFLVIATLTIVTIPIIGYALIKKAVNAGKKEVANPNLKMACRKAVYNITPTKATKIQTLELCALDEVEHYQFSLITTGSTTVAVSLVNCGVGGTLAGPIARRNADVYQVVFEKKLQKGEVVTLQLSIELDDPKTTMKPYASDTFVSCCDYGSFSAEYLFAPMPKAVHSEVVVGAHNSTAPIQVLHPRGGKYYVNEPKVIPNAAYSVSWIW